MSREQVGGDHYSKYEVQPIDVIEYNASEYLTLGYLAGNVIKYLMRFKDKNGLQDILKAQQYLEMLQSRVELYTYDVDFIKQFAEYFDNKEQEAYFRGRVLVLMIEFLKDQNDHLISEAKYCIDELVKVMQPEQLIYKGQVTDAMIANGQVADIFDNDVYARFTYKNFGKF